MNEKMRRYCTGKSTTPPIESTVHPRRHFGDFAGPLYTLLEHYSRLAIFSGHDLCFMPRIKTQSETCSASSSELTLYPLTDWSQRESCLAASKRCVPLYNNPVPPLEIFPWRSTTHTRRGHRQRQLQTLSSLLSASSSLIHWLKFSRARNLHACSLQLKATKVACYETCTCRCTCLFLTLG